MDLNIDINEEFYQNVEFNCEANPNYKGDIKLVEDKIKEFKEIYAKNSLKVVADYYMDEILNEGMFDFILENMIEECGLERDEWESIDYDFIKKNHKGKITFLFSDLGLTTIESTLTNVGVVFYININPLNLKIKEKNWDFYNNEDSANEFLKIYRDDNWLESKDYSAPQAEYYMVNFDEDQKLTFDISKNFMKLFPHDRVDKPTIRIVNNENSDSIDELDIISNGERFCVSKKLHDILSTLDIPSIRLYQASLENSEREYFFCHIFKYYDCLHVAYTEHDYEEINGKRTKKWIYTKPIIQNSFYNTSVNVNLDYRLIFIDQKGDRIFFHTSIVELLESKGIKGASYTPAYDSKDYLNLV